MIVTSETAALIGDTLGDTVGVVPLELAQFQQLLDGSRALQLLADNGPQDSEVRGLLALAVAQHLLNTHWPRYGDAVDIDIFQSRLEQRAHAAGWHVVSTGGRWPGIG